MRKKPYKTKAYYLLTKDFLQENFIEKDFSIRKISKMTGCTESTISTYLKIHGFKKESRRKDSELVGKVFNDLEVIKLGPLIKRMDKNNISKGNRSYLICKCSCGVEFPVSGHRLISGHTKSCGCKTYKKGSENKCWKGKGELRGVYLSAIRVRARHANIECNVTVDYLWELFLKQNGICTLSGMRLTFGERCGRTIIKEQTASLDRIDSSKGYVEGNVQWIHKKLQSMKMDKLDEEFIEWCEKVVKYNKRKKKNEQKTKSITSD